MTNNLEIKKLDAAKRQLITAAKLFFNDEDPVSIHTLTCAAHEILAGLSKAADSSPMLLSETRISEKYRNIFRSRVKEAKNFFKHAKKDPKDSIVFNINLNDFYLIDAIEKYFELTSDMDDYLVILRGWFCIVYPDILTVSDDKEYKLLIDNIGKLYKENKYAYYTNLLTALAQARRK